jgi:hypothetical protein
MSKFDRVNVQTLAPCCIGTIQRRPELAAEDTGTPCAECGTALVFHHGKWTGKGQDAMTSDAATVPPVIFSPPGGQHNAGIPAAPSRCNAVTRTDRGFEQCRRDEHDPAARHHVRDRTWAGGPVPLLRIGDQCGDPACCRWPERVEKYLGTTPRAGTSLKPRTAGR